MANYSFKPSLKGSLLFVLMVSLFIFLGAWQLQRAHEVSALNELQSRASLEETKTLDVLSLTPDIDKLRYRQVSMSGSYDEAHQFLLDNQLQDGRPGYQVLTPFRLANTDVAVLVNRGWVPLGADRAHLPLINLEQAPDRVQGMVDKLYRVGLNLTGAATPSPGWPSVIQVPEPEALSGSLGYSVMPYQVLLSPSASEGYVRKWQLRSAKPEKNLGYAFQWFGLALASLFLYVKSFLRANG